MLVLFFFICTSCVKSKKDIIIKNLTAETKKYWINIKDYPTKKYSGVSYDFKGAYEEFVISKDGQRIKTRLYSSPFWTLTNDNTLTNGSGDTARIEYLNEDVLILNSIVAKHKNLSVFLKSNDQKTLPIEDTTYNDVPTM